MAAAAEEESAIVADPMGLTSPINSTEQWIAPPSYIHCRIATCFHHPNHLGRSTVAENSRLSYSSFRGRYGAGPAFLIITKYENNELCRIFLGWSGKIFYELCLFCYLFGTLYALATDHDLSGHSCWEGSLM